MPRVPFASPTARSTAPSIRSTTCAGETTADIAVTSLCLPAGNHSQYLAMCWQRWPRPLWASLPGTPLPAQQGGQARSWGSVAKVGRQFMGWAVYAPSEYPLRGSRASARQRAVLRTFPQGNCSLPYRFCVAMRGSSGSAGVSWGVCSSAGVIQGVG